MVRKTHKIKTDVVFIAAGDGDYYHVQHTVMNVLALRYLCGGHVYLKWKHFIWKYRFLIETID